VPPSPSRIAPASPALSSSDNIRVDEVLGASLDDGVRAAASHQRPEDAPGGRPSATSTVMAGRSTLPLGEDAGQSEIGAHIGSIFSEAEQRRKKELQALQALDASTHPEARDFFTELFRDGASATVPARVVAADPDPELDEIQPRSPQQRAGTVRNWPEIDAGGVTEELHKRRALNPAASARSTAATGWPQAPEAATLLELAERVMPKHARVACTSLSEVLTSLDHPGIPESMRKSLPELVCQEWDRAFGPQARDAGPRCPTIGELGHKSRLQGFWVSMRLLAADKLPEPPPRMGWGGRLPAPTDPLRSWSSHANRARDALCLICAAKANGMTDAEVTALAKEKVGPSTFASMRRLARFGESDLAMVHELYGLDSASVELRRSTPGLITKQNYRTAVIALTEAFEKKYGDPGPSGIAARAALREWLPPSLKKLLPESDNPARLEMATLLMEAANAGQETLGNVCSYLIMATDASPDRRSALMAVAKRGPQLVKLRDRLQELPAP
jgi:hypothetical protein